MARKVRCDPEMWLHIARALLLVLMSPSHAWRKGQCKPQGPGTTLTSEFPFLARKYPSELVLHSP